MRRDESLHTHLLPLGRIPDVAGTAGDVAAETMPVKGEGGGLG